MHQGKHLPELLNEGLQLWLKGEEQLGFKAPAGKLSPELKEKLIAAKPELLKTMQPDRRYAPCSSGQHRLWFLEQLEGPNPVYNIFQTHEIAGELNPDTLQRCLDILVDRHDAFRTTFSSIDGQPFQVVHQVLQNQVEFMEFPGQENISSESLQSLLSEKAELVFDLQNGPLLKCELIKLAADRYVFMVICHHIVSDGLSMGLFFNELDTIYAALEQNVEPELKPLKVSFSDHVSTQLNWNRRAEAEAQLKYWLDKLAGSLEPLQLPLDKERPGVQSSKGDLLFGALSPELYSKVEKRARESQVSVFMYLTTVLNILLSRFSGQNTVLLGLPVANRENQGTDSIIGYFANTVVLRTDILEGQPFDELLMQVRSGVLEALSNQDTMFEDIVNGLNVERDRSRTPIFQTLISYEEVEHSQRTLGSLPLKNLEVPGKRARTDLSIWISKDPDTLRFGFEYATSLFHKHSIQRLLDSFIHLLEASVANIKQPISELSLLPAGEKERILVDWNRTDSEYPREKCLHQLLEQKAESHQDKAAVIFEDTELTYHELNVSANRLAHLLINKGLGAGKRIGLYMKRSADMLIALIAVQKTGAAYVPMDPDFPQDRLQYMLEDADIPLLLTQSELRSNLPEFTGERLCYEDYTAELQKQPDTNPELEPDPAAPIYIIYTSGSTGLPKGVVLPNKAVVNFLLSMKNKPGMVQSDRLLAITTLSFDIAVLELYLPLLTGATVVIAPREAVLDANLLQEMLLEHRITIMQATPASWQLLVEANWQPAAFKALCGGEAMPDSLCDALLERNVELWNMYGPTETCVWSCIEKMQPDQEKILIGKPIANTSVYILDKNLQPQPIGVPGDLWIGGDGLAIEYLNRPELTSERFVENPFEAGNRMYITGDLAKYLPDGRIECLGRSDFQLKLRGYRIEPGEIEAQLCDYSGIEQAVVCIKEFSEGDKRLVAYVITSGTWDTEFPEVQAWLRKHLPDYMVPSSLVEMEAYPLTPNGKIDRKALPLPEFKKTSQQVPSKEPIDDLERSLLEIWESVLMNKSIGIHDNFFQIGGHSLLAARIFARIEQQLDRKLPLATLFSVQTIAGLAQVIREDDISTDWKSLVPIRSTGSKTPIFLIHGAGGNVLLYRDLAKHLGEDQPVYGLQAQGLDGSMNYLTRFEDMAERYIREIREVQPRGPYYLGGYCLGGTIALEVAQQLTAIGEKVALVAMFETFNMKSLDKKYLSGSYGNIHRLQNWFFHFRNLMSLEWKERNRFFLEKARVERSRAKASFEVWYNHISGKASGNDGVEDKKVPVILDPINDMAQIQYVPQKYKGRITLFLPERNFLGYGDKYFGWEGFATDGIDIQELPLSPRGMMVEPFVRILAEKLSKCIENAREYIPESELSFKGE